MAKRSPILGYNHNVRYRGLVFHVQTEDSGMMSPHLFTHLFHGGVIISTRKLVYDAGSREDSIKSLMQAQHKAVLKDLRKGSFDDKIDLYLAGTPGLLPRGTGGDEVDVDELARASVPNLDAAAAAATAAAEASAAGRARTEVDEPPVLEPPRPEPIKPRTQTADRGSAPTKVRSNLPPALIVPDDAAPTLSDVSAAGVAAAIAAAHATVPTQMPAFDAPEIEIELELDEPDDDAAPRTARDTEAAVPADRTIRTAPVRSHDDSMSPLAAPPRARAQSAVGAASLPPARPISRPPSRQAITTPAAGVRPVAEARPESVDDGDRRGSYAQHKKSSQKLPALTDPAVVAPPARSNVPSSHPATAVRPGSGAIPSVRPSAPPARPPAVPVRTQAANSSGVVMTRPAVIVGAPPKSPTQPRIVRKAREDEGRGFGQGLISEKSLDEVILAYLSEDADDK